jgi:hypothetical protein
VAQPDRGRVEKCGDPAEAPPGQAVLRDALDAPLVADDRRGEAERHHVGEAVELLAEGGLRAHQPRHPTVQAIEDHRDENGERRPAEVAVDRGDDRVEAAEQAAGRQQVRQQVNAAAPADFGVLVGHGNGMARPVGSA